MAKLKIQAPYYPIVYVRGYAARPVDQEATFYDAYYGFSETAVDPRDTDPDEGYYTPDLFEGQLLRLMKEHNYVDAANRGAGLACRTNPQCNPSRSIWVSRFYDEDVIRRKGRGIVEHARDLQKLICVQIPAELERLNVDCSDYKVIIVAHSMGGLVSRTLIQNLLPSDGEDPKRWVHSLVTFGTPHRGIELGAVPDFIENSVLAAFNPYDARIFKEPEMRKYLLLEDPLAKRAGGGQYAQHSLGPQAEDYAAAGEKDRSFPPDRCLCLIGSDYGAYGIVEHVTGGHSDGLVKQDRAYIENAFYANLHRAHSGRRGIVNSREGYENLQRFLFGNLKVTASLEQIEIPDQNAGKDAPEPFYDFEFELAIRGIEVYLHRRRQNPCENAWRFLRSKVPQNLDLHTAFLNTDYVPVGEDYAHLALTVGVKEYPVGKTLFGLKTQIFPPLHLFTRSLEFGIWANNQGLKDDKIQAWDGVAKAWKDIQADPDGVIRIPLEDPGRFKAVLCLRAEPWAGGAPVPAKE